MRTMSRIIVDGIKNHLGELNHKVEGLCRVNGSFPGSEKIGKIALIKIGELPSPSLTKRRTFIAVILNPVTGLVKKIVIFVFSIQPLKAIRILVSFTVINVPKGLILPILKKIEKLWYTSAYNNLERLKVYNVISIGEHAELYHLVTQKSAFRNRLNVVLDRLQKENKITREQYYELISYNYCHQSSKVLTRLTQNTARYEKNKIIEDVELWRGKLGEIVEGNPNRNFALSRIDTIITSAKKKGTLTGAMDNDLAKQLVNFFEMMSPKERKDLHCEPIYAHLVYRQAHGQKGAATILRPHSYYLEKQRELDTTTREWLIVEEQVRTTIAELTPEEKTEIQEQLKEAEKLLIDLHDSYGMICTMMAKDPLIAPVASDMIGEFRSRFDVLNSILALVHAPITGKKYTHIVCGGHLIDSPHGAWPHQDQYLSKRQLLEGKDFDQYDVGESKLSINEAVLTDSMPIERQPRVLLFNIDVGNGHRSATTAIAQSLPDCIVHVGDVYDDILKEFDFGAKFSEGLSRQNVPNYLAKTERYRALNFLGNFVDIGFNKEAEMKMEAVIEKYVREFNPDVLVSVIPLLNGLFANVATKLGKKLWVVPADAGLSVFCRGITQEHCENENIHILYPYDKHEIQKTLGSQFLGSHPPKGLLDKIEDKSGYPVRRAFNQQVSEKTLNDLRSDYNIQDDENVILIMMGGNVTNAPKDYAGLLSKMSDEQLNKIVKDGSRKKFRLICLCGDTNQPENKKLQQQLNAMNNAKGRNSRVTICARERTDRIPELESLPEMFTLISKPGGATTGEAIKKGLPMVYHVGSTVLKWERPNLRIGEEKKMGQTFKATSSCSKKTQNRLVDILATNFETRGKFLSGELEIEESKLNFTEGFRDKLRLGLEKSYEDSSLYLKDYPGFGTPVKVNRVTKSLLSRIFKVVLRVGFVAVVSTGGALLFSATPIVGFVGGAAVGVGILAVAWIVSLVVHKIYSGHKYRVNLPIEIIKHNTQEGPKPGQDTKADVRVINDVATSFEWKKEIIRSAEQSVECSFNFAGSENFREILDILEDKLKNKPEFRAHLLMAQYFLESEDKKRLQELKRTYDERFNYLISERIWSTNKSIHCEENHVKLLVVDGKYFVVGGSGVHKKMNREIVPIHKEKDKTLASAVIEKAYRDTDVFGCGEAAKGLRGQFFNLYHKWAVRAGKKMGVNEGKFFRLHDDRPIADCEAFHNSENLRKGVTLKYVVGGPEHASKNPITREYAEHIRLANSEVRVANLMFIPAPNVVEALKVAKERPHVAVRGYFNGRPKGAKLSNYPISYTGRQHYGLLDEVNEYEVSGRQLHKKVATFDGGTENATAIVGTANHSPKSRYYDEELILVMKDKGVVDDVNAGLDEDAGHSKKITDTQRYRETPSLIGGLVCDVFGGLV